LEIINLTEHIKSRKRLKILKGRIIGTGGKTKEYIEKFVDVKLSILGKTVSIIGEWEKISIAREAIMMILRGCTHKTLYRWLEQKSVKKW
jgi:ribosomal RNA assembly protein